MCKTQQIDKGNYTKSKIKSTKTNKKLIQKIRFFSQIFTVLLSVWIGIEFILFVRFFESEGKTIYVERPPEVEGYLPTSSLMSLRYFLLTGEIHWAHPAGMFILTAIVLMSFAAGKFFCSWFCPVGFLAENLGVFGGKIFKQKIRMSKVIIIPFRSLKYLMLGFFTNIIFLVMELSAVMIFLAEPYNQVAASMYVR